MALNFIEGSFEGQITGTSVSIYSTLVPAPSANTKRVIRSIYVHQNDPTTIFLHIGKFKGSSFYAFCRTWLEQDDNLVSDEGDLFVLDATDESIISFYTSGSISSYPTFNVAWGDST